jgi:hypothetical protein
MLYEIIPLDDLSQHISGEGCWCEPEMDEETEMLIHNSADGREDYETGKRMPH